MVVVCESPFNGPVFRERIVLKNIYLGLDLDIAHKNVVALNDIYEHPGRLTQVYQMKISSNIHLIREASGCNIYLLESDDLILIDTGTPGNLEVVESYVEGLDREIQELSSVLLTHSHLDHVSSAPEIRSKTGTKIIAHRLDSRYLSGERKRGMLMRIGDLLSRKPNFDVDNFAEDGDEIEGFKIIHTPGHTEGSLSFYYEKERALFVGDGIRSDGKFPFGKRGNLSLSPAFFSESVSEMENSVKKIINEVEPDLLLPGHGPPVSREIDRKIKELIQGF